VCGKYSSEDTSMKQVANILRRWRWKRHVPLKILLAFNGIRIATSQKTHPLKCKQ
jgi:hypothetical protein